MWSVLHQFNKRNWNNYKVNESREICDSFDSRGEIYFNVAVLSTALHTDPTTLSQHTSRSNHFLQTMIISITTTSLQQTDICA